LLEIDSVMMILFQVLCIAVIAILTAKLAKEPWRGRILNVLKAIVTIWAFWLLLSHPIALEDGSKKVAWQLIIEQLQNIDAGTFWMYVAIATGVKSLGMMSSMYRWQLVLRGQKIELPFWHIFGSFLVGRAIGTFLPSTAGLDGYTLYDASRFSGKTVEATAAKFLEKVVGFSGVFMTFLVALPFGISIFGDDAGLVAAITVPFAFGILVAMMFVLFYPGLVQWLLENVPIPAKNRLQGIVTRVSSAAAAYRNKKSLVAAIFVLSFLVHFTTAAMYYFTALAIGVGNLAEFWPIVFGSSIQIFATVISPFTIAGEGIREAAQYLLLGSLIGPAAAIVSAALGFWAAEAPTMLGFIFWWVRPKNYTPAYCRVNGVQVDYEQAAMASRQLETEEEKAQREAEQETGQEVDPLLTRMRVAVGAGLGAGILAGILVGLLESWIIAAGGFGEEAQVLWYGPLSYAVVFGVLCALGGAVLAVLPMGREEIRGWTASLGMLATLVPFGLAITIFRLRRDVYLEQMPPLPVLLGVLAFFGALALVLFFSGRRIFSSSLGSLIRPLPALGLLAAVVIAGAVAARVAGPGTQLAAGNDIIAPHLQSQPNVILVMVDTLRADHLSCYGAQKVKTPNLCSLAEDGGSRLLGFSHASWTKPATASLLSSTLATTHQAMSKPSMLSEETILISEAMKDNGYTTGGIVTNINLAPSFGFDQGYDEYLYLAPDYLAGAEESSSKLILYQIARPIVFKLRKGQRFGDFYQDSTVVNEEVFSWLDRNGASRFFLFIHYMDPHDPYFAHPYDGDAVARVSNQHPDPAEAAAMQELYRGEIEYLDVQFGELLDRLRKDGLYDNTIIALVADHGEEFQEHGGWWHGTTLYDEQIHVPFLIKWAKGDSPSVQDGALGRMIDVAPTLLSRTGTAVPDSMQGVDVTTGARSEKDRQVFAEEDHEGNVLWSLRSDGMKLIVTNPGNPRGLPERELFDIRNDPEEINNLSGQGYDNLEAGLEGHAELQRSFAAGEAVSGGGEAEMDRAQCEQLKNLGYVEDCSHL
jgi:uncharacterized protein (TIRG00374 family)